jgi:hypothetical protein
MNDIWCSSMRSISKIIAISIFILKWNLCLLVINKGQQIVCSVFLKHFYKSLCTFLQLDNFSAKNIWVHLIFCRKSTLDQVRVRTAETHTYTDMPSSDFFRLRLNYVILAHTFCILYSLYPRFSVLQPAWCIHDVAFWNTVQYMYTKESLEMEVADSISFFSHYTHNLTSF